MSPIDVEWEEAGTLLWLRLNRPKGNILDSRMMEALAAALGEEERDPHLKLVVLRGAGGHFSFGASVEEHLPEKARAMLRAFHALVRQVAAYPVPLAALVEGQCLGGAFELVLGCHLVFAAQSAVFGCPEIKLGVFPPVLAAAGAVRLGAPAMERMLLTGVGLDADQAVRHGFAIALGAGDPADALRAWFREHLAPRSAWALRQAVAAMRDGSELLRALGDPLHRAERRYLEEVLAGHDGNEGIRAFLERRPPRWEDR
jgi:cyclohexa-1,5-dienecarbonyl-CoA hydratase